jgi:hypothetical protein
VQKIKKVVVADISEEPSDPSQPAAVSGITSRESPCYTLPGSGPAYVGAGRSGLENEGWGVGGSHAMAARSGGGGGVGGGEGVARGGGCHAMEAELASLLTYAGVRDDLPPSGPRCMC